MALSCFFKFQSEIRNLTVPKGLNNPFKNEYSPLIKTAATEFQDYIRSQMPLWEHNFDTDKGKMFGVLVVKDHEGKLGFLGTISGKLKGSKSSEKFVPSVFKDDTDDYFINKGMKELSAMGLEIKNTESSKKANELIEQRKEKSNALQKRLFDNYIFLNLKGKKKSVSQIFADSIHQNPPAAAGECAAPKLINYALENNFELIEIAEFWWGKSPKSEEREHLGFYPACKNKCRPILEFMLDDDQLFTSAKID